MRLSSRANERLTVKGLRVTFSCSCGSRRNWSRSLEDNPEDAHGTRVVHPVENSPGPDANLPRCFRQFLERSCKWLTIPRRSCGEDPKFADGGGYSRAKEDGHSKKVV